MVKIIRTDSQDEDFRALVRLLDEDLRVRDGAEHSFFAQFNKIDALNTVVVALIDDKAVGCGAFKPFDAETVEIKRMFVREENRGKGVAVEILKEIERWAAELSYTYAILETGVNQPEAIRLYEKSGYQYIPNFGQYAGIESSVCLKKKLI